MKLFYLLTFCIIMAYGCTCKETGRVNLTDQDKQLLIYKTGDSIKFKHSNGFEFKMKVISKQTSYKEDHYESVGELSCSDYVSYEANTSIIESAYPKLNFSIDVDSYNKVDKSETEYIKITLNDYYVYKVYHDKNGFINQRNNVLIDKITINNRTFQSVYKCEREDGMNVDGDIYAKYLYYSKEFGILKLEMSNNESYEINEKI